MFTDVYLNDERHSLSSLKPGEGLGKYLRTFLSNPLECLYGAGRSIKAPLSCPSRRIESVPLQRSDDNDRGHLVEGRQHRCRNGKKAISSKQNGPQGLAPYRRCRIHTYRST